MIRALLAAFFLVAAQAAHAYDTIKIYVHFETGAAITALYDYSSLTDAAQAQIDRINTALINTPGSTVRVELAGIGSGGCCGSTSQTVDSVSDTYSSSGVGALTWAYNDSGIWSNRNAYGADQVLLLTHYYGDMERGPDNAALKGVSKAIEATDPHDAIIAVNWWAVEEGTVEHEWGHSMGTRHQLATDGTTSSAHGYVYSVGDNQANCKVAWTIGASDVSYLIPKYCTGWTEGWVSGSPRICSAQQWCTDYVERFASYYPPATAASAWGTVQDYGSPYGIVCTAFDSHYSSTSSPPYVFSGGATMGYGTYGPGGGTEECLNRYPVGKWSGSSTTWYDGSSNQTMYNSTNSNEIGKINSRGSAVANFHSTTVTP